MLLALLETNFFSADIKKFAIGLPSNADVIFKKIKAKLNIYRELL